MRVTTVLLLRFRLASLLLTAPACGRGADPPAPAQQPAVLLISIDGFRADYLDRPAAVELRRLAAEGVRARWLTPIFPSVTFPNHYAIVTGLFAEHHGIVSNTMWDPATNGWFRLSDRAAVRDARWWRGEPIWVTAVKQGLRSAPFFWPGSEAAIGGVRPTYWVSYDPSVPNAARVRRTVDYLSLPPGKAPAFVTLYFNDVDHAGHQFGPDAPETDSAIARVDSAVGGLLAALETRGLSDRVNIIVVSDHGMAAVSPDRTIFLRDYIDPTTVTVVMTTPVAALVPNPGQADAVYGRLHGANPHLSVYRRDETPLRWHYRHDPRIPPIIAVADEGWQISAAARSAERGTERGSHGYDPQAPSMRALFIARGPAFRRGAVVPPFTNIHLYNLMAAILGLVPAPNDGSLDSVRAVFRSTATPASPAPHARP